MISYVGTIVCISSFDNGDNDVKVIDYITRLHATYLLVVFYDRNENIVIQNA